VYHNLFFVQDEHGVEALNFYRIETLATTAATFGNIQTVRQLWRLGADMNLVPKSRGYNPLHCALLAAGFMPKNADVMVETLLECGADPNRMTNCGTHPVELAEQSNHENCKDLLVFAGAVLSPFSLPPFPL
jgi:hypothetical protein